MVDYTQQLEYYSVVLYKQVCEFYLFEEKELKPGMYTVNPYRGSRKTYVYLMPTTFRVGTIEKYSVSYSTYSFFKKDFTVANDFSSDGFAYDAAEKKIIYGFVQIYAYKKNDIYYELITGKEIENPQVHRFSKVEKVSDLKRLHTNLDLISKCPNIYVEMVQDLLDKLTFGYHNYLNAKDQYNQNLAEMKWQKIVQEKCQEIRKRKLLEEFEWEERGAEREKIDCLIKKIQGDL